MQKIVIYLTTSCPFCYKAKNLLDNKGIPYEEIDVGKNLSKRTEMEKLSGGKHTVPQIFIGSQHIGGCDDLCDLEQQGKLDCLLSN
ncbi:MAG: glutaredoxin 3 [Hyphomicrobiaceae bacterium]|nr:glutaredoxin 3 [Hyphomicrobiaceae bacterium]